MKIAALLLTLLILTGCAAPSPLSDEPSSAEQKQADKHVILDPAVKGILRVTGIRTSTGADGILRFQADVQNLGASAKTFLYEVDWLDRDGLPLEISGEMPPWTLLPHESDSVTVTAPTPLARDFLLKFSLRAR